MVKYISKKHILFLARVLILVLPLSVFAQKRTYETNKLTTEPPHIDGILNDLAWENVEWSDQFVQIIPFENIRPTEQTQFKLTYDDDNLYFAIRAFDSAPDSIAKRLSRRDEFDGDWVKIHLDSYHDLLTGYTFGVNAAGVKGDQKITNDDDFDDNWDPIWYVKTSIDKEGWVAEMRIPLTQLRFGKQDAYIWGLQITRQLFRKGERTAWQFVSENASGWVHHFGEIYGIKDIKPQKQKDLTPYVLGKMENYKKETNNPYADGRDFSGAIGLDGKIGLTNDITLDFTINPDFGQVEADPSEVNLTTYETYLSEKRAFFIEGQDILSHSIEVGGSDNLFYSRRIGRRPGYSPTIDSDNEYVKMPQNTTILGAFKVTGKTKKGLSIGLMETVTQKEIAEIAAFNSDSALGNEYSLRQETVEPLTNYFVGRVEKDLNNSNTRVGLMATATNRDNSTDALKENMHSAAYTGGVNFSHQWKDKTYYVNFNAIAGQVQGSKEFIATTQNSAPHFFQRSDASHVEVDSTRTSLTGYGGAFEIGKAGNGKWRYESTVSLRSPGLNLNDMGYIRRNDLINQSFWVSYSEIVPKSFYRNYGFYVGQWSSATMEVEYQSFGVEAQFDIQFKNQWYAELGGSKEGKYLSPNELRGGPSLLYDGYNKLWTYIESDSRKNVVFSLTGRTGYRGGYSTAFNKLYLEVDLQLSDAFKVSLEPGVFTEYDKIAYVTTENDFDEVRYIRGYLKKIETNLILRFTYNITPDFTIQYYGMPFISAGKYQDFKYITDYRADNFNDRFALYSPEQIAYNAVEDAYTIDENKDGQVDYSFGNPNYNVLEFNSNLVLRWEYLPGSTVY
jgi:hypothetical protein